MILKRTFVDTRHVIMPAPFLTFVAARQALPIFFTSGFAPFQAEYEGMSFLLGRRIAFKEGDASIVGRVVSLGADGRLIVDVEGAPSGSAPRGYLSGEVVGLELASGEPMIQGHSI